MSIQKHIVICKSRADYLSESPAHVDDVDIHETSALMLKKLYAVYKVGLELKAVFDGHGKVLDSYGCVSKLNEALAAMEDE